MSKQKGNQPNNQSKNIIKQTKEKMQQKPAKNKSVQKLFKNVFDSPFKIEWAPLSKEKTDEISTLLGKHYFSSRIQKKRPREGFVFEKKKDKKRRLQEDREEQKEFDQASHNKKNNSAIPAIMNDNSDKDTKNSNQMEIDNYPQILSPKLMHKKAKQQAFNYEWPIIGINAVTRSLERNELALVIICMNVAPGLIQHLPPLCCKGEASMCVLSETSQNLGRLFGINSVVAMGFKKSRNYAPLVEQISKICQPVNIPWIKEKEKLLPLSYKYVEHFKEPTDKTCLVAKKTLTPKIRKQKLQVL